MSTVTATLRAALNPRTVAVVGASSDPAKFGGRVMKFLVKHGYDARIVHGMRLISPNCLGLVNPPLKLALKYACALADNAPLVLQVLRDFVGQVVPKGPSELAAHGRLAIAGVRRSEDAKEGIAAFKDKRKPRFRGR